MIADAPEETIGPYLEYIFIFIHHIVVAANKHNKQHQFRVTQDHKETRPIIPDIYKLLKQIKIKCDLI